MTKKPSILDKNLSKGKAEVCVILFKDYASQISLSTYALLFSEMVKYAQNRSENVADVRDKFVVMKFYFNDIFWVS